MNRIFTLLAYASCVLFLFQQPAAAQSARFEQLVKGNLMPGANTPVAAVQHPSGNYFALAGGGFHYTLSKLDAEGRVKNSVLTMIAFETFPMTGLGYTGTRILAVGGGADAPTKLLSLDLNFEDPKGASLTYETTRSSKVVAMPDNSVRVLTSVLRNTGYWNLRLYRLSASLAILQTDTYVASENLEPVGVFAATNGNVVMAARNLTTNNAWIGLVTPGGTFVTPAITLPEDILDATLYNDKLYVLTRSDDGFTLNLTTVDAQGGIVARPLVSFGAKIANETRLAITPAGEVAVAVKSDAELGFDLHRFSSDLAIPLGVTTHTLSYNNSTWPASMTAAQDGYVIFAGVGDISAPLSVVIKTNAQGQGGTRFFEPAAGYGLEPTAGTDARRYHWIDVNGDDRRELVITNSGPGISVYQYNTGAGQFQPMASPFPGVQDNIAGLSAADIDNDGDIDVYANRFEPLNFDPQPLPNILYRNNGNGTYTAEQGILSPAGIATRQSHWVDLNNDQWLDLYLSGARSDRAFINQGDGIHFTPLDLSNLWARENLQVPYSFAVAWDDLNGDGYLDLISSSYDGLVHIAINQHGTGFTNAPVEDYFALGDIDPYTFSARGIVKGTYQGKRTMLFGYSYYSGMEQARYFEHDGTRYVRADLPNGAWWRGNAFDGESIDFDNDGNEDLYISGPAGDAPYTGHWFNRYDGDTSYTATNFTFENFRDFTWHDFDGDGARELIGPGKVYKSTTLHHSVRVRLRGQWSPTAGIGARVSLKVNGVWQHRTITTDLGDNGQVGDEAWFGLGAATVAEELVVAWPSGCESRLTNIGHNQTVTVVEECAAAKPVATLTAPLCAKEPVGITFSPAGLRYGWYKSMDMDETPFAESSAVVSIDTLKSVRTFYVANLDGMYPSRRTAVVVDPAAPLRPAFTLTVTDNGTAHAFAVVVDGTGIDDYEWHLNDAAITGESTASASDLPAGDYTVCVALTRGTCVARSCKEFRVTDLVTGIEETTASVGVYPNPFTSYVTVETPGVPLQGTVAVLLNSAGIEVKRMPLDERGIVTLGDLAPGVYLLRVLHDDTLVKQTKIVKR